MSSGPVPQQCKTRQHLRVELPLIAEFIHSGHPVVLEAMDISIGGICLAKGDQNLSGLETGSQFAMNLVAKEGGSAESLQVPLQVIGQLIRQDDDSVAFMWIDQASSDRVADLIKRYRRIVDG